MSTVTGLSDTTTPQPARERNNPKRELQMANTFVNHWDRIVDVVVVGLGRRSTRRRDIGRRSRRAGARRREGSDDRRDDGGVGRWHLAVEQSRDGCGRCCRFARRRAHLPRSCRCRPRARSLAARGVRRHRTRDAALPRGPHTGAHPHPAAPRLLHAVGFEGHVPQPGRTVEANPYPVGAELLEWKDRIVKRAR